MADNRLVLPAPFQSLDDAWFAFRDLYDQLGPLIHADLDEGPNDTGHAIGVDEVAIAHGLGLVPRMVLHMASNGAAVEATRRDERFTYWRASVATTIKIVVIP